MKQKERNSNFELMRIISMLFIVFWHMYIFGGIRDRGVVQNPSLKVIFDFMSFVLIVHVNSFVLLTGYFSWNKKIRINKIFSIIFQSLFYKILFIIVFLSLGIFTFTKIDIIRNLFPLELNYNDAYWFIRYFLYLYMLIPFINKLIKSLTKKDYQRMLLVLLFVFSLIPFITGTKSMENNGYTLYQFILMYIIGAYLGKYKVKDRITISINIYRIILITIFFACAIFNFCIYQTSESIRGFNSVYNEVLGNISMMHKNYSNPLVIIQSISYFLLFETIDFKSRFVNKVASLTLGVYLIHNNFYVRGTIYSFLKIDGGPYQSYKYLLYFLIIGILLFIVCAIIEFIRQLIVGFLSKRKLSIKIRNKFYSFIESLKIKESNVKE